MGVSKNKDSFEVEDQKLAMKWNLFILTTFGYWAPESYSQEKLTLYRWHTVVVVGLTLFVYTVLEIVSLFVLTDGIDDVISSSFLLLTHLVQWFKFFCFFNNRVHIIGLMNKLNQKEFLPLNKTQKNLLAHQVEYGKKNFILFLVLSTITVSLWVVLPFIESTGEMDLPLKTWFPFDIHHSPTFEIIYVYQAVALMVTAQTDVSMVTVVGIFMASVCGQLDILNNKLQNLRMKKEVMRSPDDDLVECIRHHLKIVE